MTIIDTSTPGDNFFFLERDLEGVVFAPMPFPTVSAPAVFSVSVRLNVCECAMHTRARVFYSRQLRRLF